MTLGHRGKLLLIVGGFALPIVASVLVYTFGHPRATSNYGELLLPPDTVTTARFAAADGRDFRFPSLAGRWIVVAADRSPCDAACRSKLVAVRQVRLALGREADRVATVAVLEGPGAAEASLRADFPDMTFARPTQPAPARAPTADRAHIYLVDPNGNVMMRWPAQPDYKRMKNDLDRLLRASQIG